MHSNRSSLEIKNCFPSICTNLPRKQFLPCCIWQFHLPPFSISIHLVQFLSICLWYLYVKGSRIDLLQRNFITQIPPLSSNYIISIYWKKSHTVNMNIWRRRVDNEMIWGTTVRLLNGGSRGSAAVGRIRRSGRSEGRVSELTWACRLQEVAMKQCRRRSGQSWSCQWADLGVSATRSGYGTISTTIGTELILSVSWPGRIVSATRSG